MPPTLSITAERARELAAQLATRVGQNADDRELVEFVCNALRVKKTIAAEIVETFQSGYHAGVHSVLSMDGPPPVRADEPIWHHAFEAGSQRTMGTLANHRRKHRIPVPRLLLLAGIVVGLAVYGYVALVD